MIAAPRARWLLGALLLFIYATLSVARVVSNALRDAGVLRLTVAVCFSLAAVVVAVTIGRIRALRRPKTLGVLVLCGLGYAAVIWPMESPEEKLHFIEYGLVGLLTFASMPERWSTWPRFLFGALLTLAAGWLDEGIQGLLPTRHYDLRDVGFNLLAGLLAMTAFLFVRATGRSEVAARA